MVKRYRVTGDGGRGQDEIECSCGYLNLGAVKRKGVSVAEIAPLPDMDVLWTKGNPAAFHFEHIIHPRPISP